MIFSRTLRHSDWDSLLILLSFAQGAVLATAPSVPAIALGLWWNANTISHSFIHLPFFNSKRLNRLYSFYLTLLLGFPQSLWRERHLAHHAGLTTRTRLAGLIRWESLLVIGLWGLLAYQAPRFFAAVYMPGWFLGLGLCYLHGFFEHAPLTASHYSPAYNVLFFNDGYHVEHHRFPTEHWQQLPRRAPRNTRISRWPAVLRWIDVFNLEFLERMVVHSPWLQRFLLRTHEQALRKLMPRLKDVQSVTIVGGGIFPRTAILLRRLMPWVEITILDINSENIEMSKPFLDGRVRFVHQAFAPGTPVDTDLLVIPLSFIGDRNAVYRNPPARIVLVHDWIWSRRAEGVIVCVRLLKRLNVVLRSLLL